MPELQVPDTAHFVTTTGRQHHVTIQVRDTTGGGIAWTAQVLSGGTWITLNQSSGTTPSNLIMTLTSDLAGLAVPQSQATGTVRITADTLTKDINVSLVLASTLEEVWLPFITR
ncbi:MAG: hypothetical protein HGA65_10250 [Oscillochloris sp.]|nr:hypothetical protein [Oscillochloris sp.]